MKSIGESEKVRERTLESSQCLIGLETGAKRFALSLFGLNQELPVDGALRVMQISAWENK